MLRTFSLEILHNFAAASDLEDTILFGHLDHLALLEEFSGPVAGNNLDID